MIVDIYIREKAGSREIRVPWLPEEIDYDSGGTTFASYDIMNRGEVSVPTGSGLAGVSWESDFPGKMRSDESMLRGSWQDQKVYHAMLEDWKKNGTALNLLVTGFPINLDVHLEDYNGTATGGFGDWHYKLKFVEDREITISSTKAATQTKRPSATAAQTNYTVKKGDTLWGIAKKMLGAGSKWQTIYSANKEIIESTAKKYGKKSSNNGWWIYPGTVLKIPK